MKGLKKFMLERSCMWIKHHYGNETFLLEPITKKGYAYSWQKTSLKQSVCFNDILEKNFYNFANCYCAKLKNIFNKWLDKDMFSGLTEIAPVFYKT